MGSQRAARIGSLAGIAFVVLIVAAVVIGGETPDNDDSQQSIVNFWKENDTEQIWTSVIVAWSLFFFVWFAASVRAVLRRAEGEVGRLSAVSFGGALIAAGGFLVLVGFNFAAADTVGDVPPDVTHTLSVLSNEIFFPVAVGFGLFFAATGVVSLRTSVLPAWAAWLTIVIGIACITPIGFFALLVGLVWILVMSIVLYRRDGASQATSAPVA